MAKRANLGPPSIRHVDRLRSYTRRVARSLVPWLPRSPATGTSSATISVLALLVDGRFGGLTLGAFFAHGAMGACLFARKRV